MMVWGMIVPGKGCGATAWLIAGSVTGMVSEFLMSGLSSSSDDSVSMHGLVLPAGFLVRDGFTSTSR